MHCSLNLSFTFHIRRVNPVLILGKIDDVITSFTLKLIQHLPLLIIFSTVFSVFNLSFVWWFMSILKSNSRLIFCYYLGYYYQWCKFCFQTLLLRHIFSYLVLTWVVMIKGLIMLVVSNISPSLCVLFFDCFFCLLLPGNIELSSSVGSGSSCGCLMGTISKTLMLMIVI